MLGVPTPRPIATVGVALVMLTFRLPICWTVNVCVLVPRTSSVSLKVSEIVPRTGVGVAGTTGSAHAAVSRATPRTADSVSFISLNHTRQRGGDVYRSWSARPLRLREGRTEGQSEGDGDANRQ